MPLFDLSPPAAPVDHDSLAARQARHAQQTEDAGKAFMAQTRQELAARYANPWGAHRPDPSPSERRTENTLSPAEVLASYGAKAAGYFGLFAALVLVAIQGGALAPDGTHPQTGEDMTRCPEGWSVAFAPDGTGTATYTPPEPAPAPSDAQG